MGVTLTTQILFAARKSWRPKAFFSLDRVFPAVKKEPAMGLLSCPVALPLLGQLLKKFSKKLLLKSMETPAVIGLAKADLVITLKWYTTVCLLLLPLNSA